MVLIRTVIIQKSIVIDLLWTKALDHLGCKAIRETLDLPLIPCSLSSNDSLLIHGREEISN